MRTVGTGLTGGPGSACTSITGEREGAVLRITGTNKNARTKPNTVLPDGSFSGRSAREFEECADSRDRRTRARGSSGTAGWPASVTAESARSDHAAAHGASASGLGRGRVTFGHDRSTGGSRGRIAKVSKIRGTAP